jgi:hypothetical protein
MSLLRFYPGATPGKKGNKLKITMKSRKRNKNTKKNRSDRKFSSKWQTERHWLVFMEKKNCDDMHYMNKCIEIFQSDKISNPFISHCSNLRTLSVTDMNSPKPT